MLPYDDLHRSFHPRGGTEIADEGIAMGWILAYHPGLLDRRPGRNESHVVVHGHGDLGPGGLVTGGLLMGGLGDGNI